MTKTGREGNKQTGQWRAACFVCWMLDAECLLYGKAVGPHNWRVPSGANANASSALGGGGPMTWPRFSRGTLFGLFSFP